MHKIEETPYCNYYGRLEPIIPSHTLGHMMLDDYIKKSVDKQVKLFGNGLITLFKELRKDISEDIRMINKSINNLHQRLDEKESPTVPPKKKRK